jgi:hypothetical protein
MRWGRDGIRAVALVAVVGTLTVGPTTVSAQQKPVTAADGWVKAPAPGETTAAAFALIRNPTMYDIYVTAAASDAAGSVELRQAAPGTPGKAVKEITVPAYESLALGPAGMHLLLKDLKKPLKPGETVGLTLTTDQGVLKVAAVVK